MARANQQLKNEREKLSLSQEEVAERIDTTASNVSRWERGITFPTPHFRRKLCELFQKSPQELFPDSFEGIDTSVPPGSLQAASALSPPPGVKPGEPPVSPAAFTDQLQSTTVFFFNTTLTDARECYGRAREKTTLLSRTQKGESTSIVVPRGIGKNWLMNYLRLVAPTRLGTHLCIGYLDATIPSCATLGGFTTEALKGLGIPALPEADTSVQLEALEMGVKDLRAKNQVPILCIDEFESFCKQREFHIGVLENLRAISQAGLGLVITSKRPLIEVVTETTGETSPFFNVFRQLTLKPFTLQEANVFVQAKGEEAQFTEKERGYLLKYGRQRDREEWPALRLQLVGTLLQEDKILAVQESSDYYRPNEQDYWQEFEERVEEAYQGVVR